MSIHLSSIYTFDIILITMPTSTATPRNPESKNKDLKTNGVVSRGHRSQLEADPTDQTKDNFSFKKNNVYNCL